MPDNTELLAVFEYETGYGRMETDDEDDVPTERQTEIRCPSERVLQDGSRVQSRVEARERLLLFLDRKGIRVGEFKRNGGTRGPSNFRAMGQ